MNVDANAVCHAIESGSDTSNLLKKWQVSCRVYERALDAAEASRRKDRC